MAGRHTQYRGHEIGVDGEDHEPGTRKVAPGSFCSRPKQVSMFPQNERNVFGFQYQGTLVYADPIAVLRALKLATRGRLSKLIEEANAINPVPGPDAAPPPDPEDPRHLTALLARGGLAGAVVSAFGLPPFDPMSGQGTLEEEALDLLRAFLEWQHAKKLSGETPSS